VRLVVMAKSKSNTQAEAPASTGIADEGAAEQVSAARPATARRAVSERDVTADMEARNVLGSLAEDLAGMSMEHAEAGDEAEEPKVKERKPNPKTAKAGTEDEEEKADAAEDEGEDGTKPILSDDDDETADESEDDDPAEGEDGDDEPTAERKAKALEKRNYKLREQKRELESIRESLTAEVEGLKAKVRELETLPSGAMADGPFAQAKTEADVGQVRGQFEQKLEWLEDLLDDHQDSYFLKDANGEEKEYTRRQVRDELKWTRKMLGDADRAMEAIQRTAQAEKSARELYPFVFDPQSKHNSTVVDLVKETPELNRVPNKALLLGRLAVGKLVESGKYLLVPKHKAGQSKAAAAPVKASSPSPLPARKAAAAGKTATDRNLIERIGSGDRDAQNEWAMGLLED
jgi:hypothetical protein